jgi:hypothetical protein
MKIWQVPAPPPVGAGSLNSWLNWDMAEAVTAATCQRDSAEQAVTGGCTITDRMGG